MKRKLILIVVSIGFFLIALLIRFFIFDRPTATGRLKVRSTPSAGIFLNDEPVGNTPNDLRKKPGEYSIKLIPEGKNAGLVPWEGKVTISGDTVTVVNRNLASENLKSSGIILSVEKAKDNPGSLKGILSVQSDPSGAIIFLNNEEIGITPYSTTYAAGEYELALTLPGFIRIAEKISIPEGFEVVASVKLALDENHKTLDTALEDKAKEASLAASLTPSPEVKSVSNQVKILGTPTGFLNVRAEPSATAEQIDQVKPDKLFIFKEKKSGWYLIVLDDASEGWVSGDYVEEVKN